MKISLEIPIEADMMNREVIMVYRGHVRNGNIALDEPVALPEGAAVEVQITGSDARGPGNEPKKKLEPFEPIRMERDSTARPSKTAVLNELEALQHELPKSSFDQIKADITAGKH